MTNVRNVLRDLRRNERIILTLNFSLIFFLLVYDVVEDLFSGTSTTHVIVETLVLFLSIIGIVVMWAKYLTTRKNFKELELDLKQVKLDLSLYKSETKALTEGLSQKIDDQLQKWQLTNAEKDIVLLILKGLNNRDISELRNTKEQTIRQQITIIFQKTNLKSRLELSTFFLEDLLLSPDLKR